MKVLFVMPAASQYDQQNRVMGWRATPSSRESLKSLRALVERLRELGATRVICSDLDGQSGHLLGRRLNVPVEEWQSLRRLNVGKHHGTPSSKFEKLHESMQSQWKDNPDIPIQGGDSRTSYLKRMKATRARLTTIPYTTVVVAGALEICELIGARVIVKRGRIYEWDTGADSPAVYKEGRSGAARESKTLQPAHA